MGSDEAVIMKCLNDLREKSNFCDLTIIIGKQRYPCHRVFLISVSGYFRSFFTVNLPRDSLSETVLENVDGKTFEIILQYAYSGDLKIDRQNAYALLKAADYLQIERIVDRSVHFIEKHSDVDHLLEICLYASHPMNHDQLVRKVAKHVSTKLETLAKDSLFLKIPFEVLDLILQYATGEGNSIDRHNVSSTDIRSKDSKLIRSRNKDKVSKMIFNTRILRICTKWIKHDVAERIGFFSQLYAYASLPGIYRSELKSLLDCLVEESTCKQCSSIASSSSISE